MVVKVQKVGHSLMVTIPKPLARDLDLIEGDEVTVVREESRSRIFRIKPLRRRKFTLKEISGSINIPNFDFRKTEKTLAEEYGR